MTGVQTCALPISGNAQNIGFAIPIETALPDVDRILEGLGKAFIGIGFVTNNDEYQQPFRLATNEGVIITTVLPTGPADIAGFHISDIIIAVNGENVSNESSFEATVVDAEPGNVLELTVIRGRQQGMIDITVGER